VSNQCPRFEVGAAIYTLPRGRANLRELEQQGGFKMAKRGLDGRHRDTTGRIDRKHGNTRVGALRKTYGEHFAKGRRNDAQESLGGNRH